MSLFNHLIWLFFIPAIVYFVVMYFSYLSVVSFLLPVGLIAQSVEHCTSIAEIMSGNVVQAFFLVSGLNSTAAYDVYATEMIFHDCILF